MLHSDDLGQLGTAIDEIGERIAAVTCDGGNVGLGEISDIQ